MRTWVGLVVASILLAGCAKAPAPMPTPMLSAEDAKWSRHPHANISAPSSIRWHIVRTLEERYLIASALFHLHAKMNATQSDAQRMLVFRVDALSQAKNCGPLIDAVRQVPRDTSRQSIDLEPGWYYVIAMPREFARIAKMSLNLKTGGLVFDMTNQTVPWIEGGMLARTSEPATGPSTVDLVRTPPAAGVWMGWANGQIVSRLPGDMFGFGPGANAGYTYTVSFGGGCQPVSTTRTPLPDEDHPYPGVQVYENLDTSAMGPPGEIRFVSAYEPEQDQSAHVEHTLELTWVVVGDPPAPK